MMNIQKKIDTKAFTLLEILITLGLFSVILMGILTGSFALKRNLKRTGSFVEARQEVSNFVQTVLSFSNKSLGIFFYDETSSSEMDYLTDSPSLSSDDDIYNSVYFVKDASGTLGSMIYDPTEKTISWVRVPGADPQVLLSGVLRPDYVGPSDMGSEPIFKFPHTLALYDTLLSPPRPNLLVVELKKEVDGTEGSDGIPITIPIKLISQVNTIN